MATEVVDKIINIDVRYTDAIKAMGELSANLTRNKEELQLLKQLYKEGELSLRDYSQQQSVLTAENKILTQQLRVYQKEIENNVKKEEVAEGSLNALRAEYAKNTAAISAMSKAEREAAEGQALIKHIADLKREISGVEKSLMDFRGSVGAAEVVDKIINIDVRNTDAIKAMGELSANLTRNKEELQLLKHQYKEGELSLKDYSRQQGVLTAENKILTQQLRVYQKEVENNVKIEKAHEGSLDSLRAEYAKNTAAISAMSRAEREAAEGQALIKHSADLKREINGVEQSLMDFRGNVGNYRSGFDGLGMSIAQITREAPAFAHSLTTGFMAISNNIPIMVDEIDRLRKANKALNEEGIKTPSVMSSIVKGLFSWQTLLSVGVTLLTIYGAELVEWASGLFGGATAAEKAAEKTRLFNEELDKAMSNVAEQSVRINVLSEQWKALGDNIQAQEQFLIANREELDKTGLSIKTVEGANKALIDQLPQYLEYLDRKARAEAAYNLAVQENEKRIADINKLESERIEAVQVLEEKRASLIERNADRISLRLFDELETIRKIDAELKVNRDATNSYQDDIIKYNTEAANILRGLYVDIDTSVTNLQAVGYDLGFLDLSDIKFDDEKMLDSFIKSFDNLQKLSYELTEKTAEAEKAELQRLANNEIASIQARLNTEEDMTLAERNTLNDTIILLQSKLAAGLLEVDKKYAKDSLDAQIAARVAAMQSEEMQTRLTMGREGATDEEIDLALGQQRVSALQSTFAQLKSLTDSEQDALYDSKQAYNDAVLAADLALYEAEKDLTQQTKEEADARRQIRQAELAATASVFGSLGAIVGAFGEENRAALILSKTLAIAEIAIQQGIAIAQVTRSAARSSFSVYDFAAQLALGIASVTSAIASAVSAVNSADIGGGDSASVTFTPATSSLTSTTPTGWSSTLSSMNVASGQSAIDTANIPNSMGSYAEMEAMMTRAFEAMPAPIVTVKDYETEKKKVQIADNVARLN